MNDIVHFKQYIENLNENVSFDVLQINYTLYALEKYFKSNGIDISKLVSFLLDNTFFEIEDTKTDLLSKALHRVVTLTSTPSSLLANQKFTQAVLFITNIKNEPIVKYKDIEAVLIFINSFYLNKPNHSKENLWFSCCPEIEQVLHIDGFPLSNQALISRNRKESNSKYIELVENIVNFVSNKEELYIQISNALIIKLLLELGSVKHDLEFTSLLERWQKRTNISMSVVEKYMFELSQAHFNWFYILSSFNEDDREHIKEIKRSLKLWFCD